jgi:hypothetical protein
MPIRTTVTDVRAIINTDLTDAIVTAYITSASALIDFNLGTDVTPILTEIERWTAAHMIAATQERISQKEGAGPGIQIEYMGTSGEGFHSTPYGQMVLSLDYTGTLALSGRLPASIYVIPSTKYY